MKWKSEQERCGVTGVINRTEDFTEALVKRYNLERSEAWLNNIMLCDDPIKDLTMVFVGRYHTIPSIRMPLEPIFKQRLIEKGCHVLIVNSSKGTNSFSN